MQSTNRLSTIGNIQREGTATHCPYCAFQCGMHVVGPREQAGVTGNQDFPVNLGALCVKGWSSPATLAHSERLLAPLARQADGSFTSITWDDALGRIVQKVQDIQRRYGRDAVGIFGGGSLTNEKAYLLGKFARVALGTANIDYNGRFCMSSAAAASLKAFGLDRGLPFPLEDICYTSVLLLVGSNIAETMPPMMQYLDVQRRQGGRLITVDPRVSPTAQAASLHLGLAPGTDAALANGLLHILIRDNLIDHEYIRERTAGFEQVKAMAAMYWPERVERITGVAENTLIQAAHMLGRAPSAMILTARGAEQQSQGVNNTLAYINLALALGLVGRAYSGYGCLTGQGNGQGGREHGQKADQLPGYRKIDDPAARKYIARIWRIAPADLPGPGKSAYEMLNTLGEEGGVRALLVMGSNIVVSAPNAQYIEQRLRELDLLVVADFFLSETAQQADIVLPMAQWAEEEGVFVFRTLDDCSEMITYSAHAHRVAVIGGGLLGLEAARGMLNRGLEVHVIHLSPQIMNVQLDEPASEILRSTLEKMGVHFHVDKNTTAVLGEDQVAGLAFADGTELACDMCIISAGIRPNVDLARRAGQEVERGIVVGDGLLCSAPGIYALGECCQHRGRVYDLVAPLWEQARLLAERLTSESCQKVYEGSPESTKLKVVGVELAVMGEKDLRDTGDEVVTYTEPARGIYKKIIVREGRLAGAIFLGDAPTLPRLRQLFDRGELLPENRAELQLQRRLQRRDCLGCQERAAQLEDAL